MPVTESTAINTTNDLETINTIQEIETIEKASAGEESITNIE